MPEDVENSRGEGLGLPSPEEQDLNNMQLEENSSNINAAHDLNNMHQLQENSSNINAAHDLNNMQLQENSSNINAARAGLHPLTPGGSSRRGAVDLQLQDEKESGDKNERLLGSTPPRAFKKRRLLSPEVDHAEDEDQLHQQHRGGPFCSAFEQGEDDQEAQQEMMKKYKNNKKNIKNVVEDGSSLPVQTLSCSNSVSDTASKMNGGSLLERLNPRGQGRIVDQEEQGHEELQTTAAFHLPQDEESRTARAFLQPYPEMATPVSEYRVAISNRRVCSITLESGERFDWATRTGTMVKHGTVSATGKTLVFAKGVKVVDDIKPETLVKTMLETKGAPYHFKFTMAERKKLEAAAGFAARKDEEEAHRWTKVAQEEEEFIWNDGSPKWQKKCKKKVDPKTHKPPARRGPDRERQNRQEGDKIFADVYKALHQKYYTTSTTTTSSSCTTENISSNSKCGKSSSSSVVDKSMKTLQLVFSQADFADWFAHLPKNAQSIFNDAAQAQRHPERYQDVDHHVYRAVGPRGGEQCSASSSSSSKNVAGAEMGRQRHAEMGSPQMLLSDPNFSVENRAGSFRDPSMLGAVGAYFSSDDNKQHRCFTLSRDLLSYLALGGSRGNSYFRCNSTLVKSADENGRLYNNLHKRPLRVLGRQWDRGGETLASATGFGVHCCILPIVRVFVCPVPGNQIGEKPSPSAGAKVSFQVELINVGGQLVYDLQAKMRFPCRSLKASVSVQMQMDTQYPSKAIMKDAAALQDKSCKTNHTGGEEQDEASSYNNSSAYWIPSNDADETMHQPPHWSPEHPLRPEQLRALGWLTKKERAVDHFKCVIPIFNGRADLLDADALTSSNSSDGKKNAKKQPMKKRAKAEEGNSTKKDLPSGNLEVVDNVETNGTNDRGDDDSKNNAEAGPAPPSKSSSTEEAEERSIIIKKDEAEGGKQSWCAYSELEAEYLVRGGLLCDKPGHGKTATMIGVVLYGVAHPYGEAFEPDPGCFSAPETTLILVPKRLVRQWEEEFEKFCEKNFYRDQLKKRIRVVETVEQYQKLSVKDIQNTWVLLMPFDVPFHSKLKVRARGLTLGGGYSGYARDVPFTPASCCMRLLRHATYLFKQHVLEDQEVQDAKKNKKQVVAKKNKKNNITTSSSKAKSKTEAEKRFEQEDAELRARLRSYRKAREWQDERHKVEDKKKGYADFWEFYDGGYEYVWKERQMLNPHYRRNFEPGGALHDPSGPNCWHTQRMNFRNACGQNNQNNYNLKHLQNNNGRGNKQQQQAGRRRPLQPEFTTREVRERQSTGCCVPENLRCDAANLVFPVLEQIKFGRIVYDEFHESESFKSQEVHTLCNLQAHARFGLTGTPKQEDTRSIVAAASLFQVDFVGQDAADAVMLNKVEYTSSKYLDLLRSCGEKDLSRVWAEKLNVDWRNIHAEKLDEFSFGEDRHFGSKVVDATTVRRFCNCCGEPHEEQEGSPNNYKGERRGSGNLMTFDDELVHIHGSLYDPEFICAYCGEKNHVAPRMLQVQGSRGAAAAANNKAKTSSKRLRNEDAHPPAQYKVFEREFLLQRAAFLSKHAWDRSAYFRKYAQDFVEHFMRQNSIKGVEDEIEVVEKLIRVVLQPEERVLYKNEEQSLQYALASSSEENSVSVLEVESFGLLDDHLEDEEVHQEDGTTASASCRKSVKVIQHNNHEKLAVRKGYLSAEDLKKRTALLKLCCHFQNKDDSAGSAKEQVAAVAEKKRKETEQRKKEIHKIILKMLCYERAAAFFHTKNMPRVTKNLETITLDDVTGILSTVLQLDKQEQAPDDFDSDTKANKHAVSSSSSAAAPAPPPPAAPRAANMKKSNQTSTKSVERTAFETLVQSAKDFWATNDALDSHELIAAAFGKNSWPPAKHLLQKVLRRDLMERHIFERTGMAAEDERDAAAQVESTKKLSSTQWPLTTEKQFRAEVDAGLGVIFDDFDEFVAGFWLDEEVKKKSRLVKARRENEELQEQIKRSEMDDEGNLVDPFNEDEIIKAKDVNRARVARACEANIRDASKRLLDPTDLSVVHVSVTQKKGSKAEDEEDSKSDRAAENWQRLVKPLLDENLHYRHAKNYAKGITDLMRLGAKLKEELSKTGIEIKETMDAEFAFQRLCSVSEGNLNYFKSVMSSDQLAITDGDSQEIECPICLDEFEPNGMLVIERCCHVFCKGCLSDLLKSGTAQICPTCRGPCSLEKTQNFEEVLQSYRGYEQKFGKKFEQHHAEQDEQKQPQEMMEDSSATKAGASSSFATSSKQVLQSGASSSSLGGMLGGACEGKAPTNPHYPLPKKKQNWLEAESANEATQIESVWMKKIKRKDKHGSKLHYVAALLEKILTEDKTAKVIIFTQFSDLQWQVMEALDDYKAVKYTTVRDRSGLQDFQKKLSADSVAQLEAADPDALQLEKRVLLLSLEKEASGLNLTSANHVFLLHPMCTETVDKACAFELQAIARVRRLGQTRKEVTMWRLVTADTVEQDLVLEHRQQIDARKKHKEEHAKKVAARELASKQKDKALQAKVGAAAVVRNQNYNSLFFLGGGRAEESSSVNLSSSTWNANGDRRDFSNPFNSGSTSGALGGGASSSSSSSAGPPGASSSSSDGHGRNAQGQFLPGWGAGTSSTSSGSKSTSSGLGLGGGGGAFFGGGSSSSSSSSGIGIAPAAQDSSFSSFFGCGTNGYGKDLHARSLNGNGNSRTLHVIHDEDDVSDRMEVDHQEGEDGSKPLFTAHELGSILQDWLRRDADALLERKTSDADSNAKDRARGMDVDEVIELSSPSPSDDSAADNVDKLQHRHQGTGVLVEAEDPVEKLAREHQRQEDHDLANGRGGCVGGPGTSDRKNLQAQHHHQNAEAGGGLVSSLVAMGFSNALAQEAARHNKGLQEAVDYCLAKQFE
ncbi:unnamed protein product [Amoebophrya sp. A25]|nr:unnamed protein product [Amoebophrya sp. A25]|eukprot:GSA25T00022971001.1